MILVDELGAEWHEAMLEGDFGRAWRASDRFRALHLPDPHRFWLGEDISGKRVLVRCLHGFGDSLQFLRYLPLLQARAASVCVEVGPRFAELARCLDGATNVIIWGEPEPAWDVQVEVMELPYLFRTELPDLPIATRYLQVAPATEPPRTQSLRIGLMGTAGQWNPGRGMPFELLQPLLSVGDCEFWNLAPTVCNDAALQEDEACRDNLLGLARRVAALDLVVTVDTVAAHMAGALGVPAWVLLQHQSDWRWMRARSDSPWYPTLRLFRQGRDCSWAPVLAQVTQALTDLRNSQ